MRLISWEKLSTPRPITRPRSGALLVGKNYLADGKQGINLPSQNAKSGQKLPPKRTILAANMNESERNMNVLGRVTSINVRKVLWALNELGMPYEREDWGLPLRDPKVPEFLALNPNGQVPVIRDGEVTLWESTAILIYIADRYGPGLLLPTEPGARGRALQWLVWQATELNPTWGYAVNARLRNTPGYDDPVKVRESIVRWSGKMQILENQLARGGEFVDGAFSIADIALGLSVHRWYGVPDEKPEFPVVSEYYRRLRERPAGAEWMAPETP